jgi:hypothetical protein
MQQLIYAQLLMTMHVAWQSKLTLIAVAVPLPQFLFSEEHFA